MDLSKKAGLGNVWPVRLIAICFFASGVALFVGGAKLVTLGGSWYYVLTGLALAVTAFLLWTGRELAAKLHLVTLVGTWIWAFLETGWNGWAIVPRVDWISGLALAFLLPPVRRHLGWTVTRATSRGLAGLAGSAVIAIALIFLIRPGDAPNRSVDGSTAAAGESTDWTDWGGDAGGERFANISQITTANVGALELAWSYETGAAPRAGGAPALAFEVTPLKIGNRLFGCTPHNVVFALDPATGRELWRHDPEVRDEGLAFANCRGVAYADLSARGLVESGAASAAPGACIRRIYAGTIDARLLALDAETGSPCQDFGEGGAVDMRRNMGRHEASYYYYTSTPTVSGGVVVVGSYGLDGQVVKQPSGVIRAYDLRTGRQVWDFDPADPSRTAPLSDKEVYEPGSPNSWSISSTDEELGLVYVPFGVATPDYYGGERTKGAEAFSNAIVALDNKNGSVRWSFQTVHHDVWDYDIASQPVLVDFPLGKRAVPALVSISKTGDVFVLDRRTGVPLMPVEERPVPKGGVSGERLSRTQPFSLGMPTLAGDRLTEAKMWGLTPFDQLWCRIEFRSLRYEGRFTPPSLEGTLQFPGFTGGVNWGGFSIDRKHQLLLVNSNQLPTKARLITPEQAAAIGMKPAGAGVRISPEAVRQGVPQYGSRYAVLNGTLMSPFQVPCLQPPVGKLTAIDLRSRTIAWEKPIGTADRMGPMGIASRIPLTFGLPTVGGPLATAGGLTFIASTPDRRIRAYATATGKLLWQADLPANGNANPMSYVAGDGRQYVVVAAGGSAALASNERNVLVAFALPGRN